MEVDRDAGIEQHGEPAHVRGEQCACGIILYEDIGKGDVAKAGGVEDKVDNLRNDAGGGGIETVEEKERVSDTRLELVEGGGDDPWCKNERN